MPSRVPCDAGATRESVSRPAAWTTGWSSCPVSPGSRPGLLGADTGSIPAAKLWRRRVGCPPGGPSLVSPGPSGPGAHTKSPRRKPGDSGLRAFPRAMRCGCDPGKREQTCGMDDGMVFVPGVPGLPPGASWNGHGIDSLRKALAAPCWLPAWRAGPWEPAAAGQAMRGRIPMLAVNQHRQDADACREALITARFAAAEAAWYGLGVVGVAVFNAAHMGFAARATGCPQPRASPAA